MNSVNFTRELPVLDSTDILVVGGGPSGIAAAVCAARLGKKVTLLEQSGTLGGMMSLANVAIFMEVGTLTGFYRELVKLNFPTFDDPDTKNPERTRFNPLLMRFICLKLVRDAGVDLRLHTQFVSVLKDEDGNPCGAAVHTRAGLSAIYAKRIIDCSGDGGVAIDAGAEYTTGRPGDNLTQPMTLMFQLQNTGSPVTPLTPEGCFHYDTVESLPQGRLLFWDRSGEGTVLVNMTRVKGNGADPDRISDAEYEGLQQAFGVAEYLQKHHFPNHVLSSIPPQIGVRQTNQVVGLYTLTEGEITRACRFEDVVTQTNYEIDIHDPNGGGTCDERKIDLYDIPYRCMVPKGVNRMLVAGRAISVDHVTMSSMRVMPTCFGLGQAAGVAAAISLDDNCEPAEIDIQKLRTLLEAQGVEFQR